MKTALKPVKILIDIIAKNAWAVLESEAVLEITNGEDNISILRTAKSESLVLCTPEQKAVYNNSRLEVIPKILLKIVCQ